MVIQTIYCDYCEHIVRLTEDGYCIECGKHADNMPKTEEDELKHINEGGYEPEEGDYYPARHVDPDYDELGGEG